MSSHTNFKSKVMLAFAQVHAAYEGKMPHRCEI